MSKCEDLASRMVIPFLRDFLKGEQALLAVLGVRPGPAGQVGAEGRCTLLDCKEVICNQE